MVLVGWLVLVIGHGDAWALEERDRFRGWRSRKGFDRRRENAE